MTSAFRTKSFLLVILASPILTALCFVALNNFLRVQIIPCADTWTQNLISALSFALVVQIFLAPKILPGDYKIFLGAHTIPILLAVWLGLYPLSPLGYADGRIPVLRGFVVTTLGRDRFVKTGGSISLQEGAAADIAPQILSGDFHCTWMSAKGGALDGLNNCEVIYAPPNALYDILRVSIQSACGLPDSVGVIKVSILP